MKKSMVIDLVGSVLRRYNTGHYSYNETKHAKEILTVLEDLKLLKPTHEILTVLEDLKLLKPTHEKTIVRRDLELMPYEDTITVEGWEDE